tara:strand:- start:75 stop:401 length:327 start_codon:yes stop_codon:yes gene_type:complete
MFSETIYPSPKQEYSVTPLEANKGETSYPSVPILLLNLPIDLEDPNQSKFPRVRHLHKETQLSPNEHSQKKEEQNHVFNCLKYIYTTLQFCSITNVEDYSNFMTKHFD